MIADVLFLLPSLSPSPSQPCSLYLHAILTFGQPSTVKTILPAFGSPVPLCLPAVATKYGVSTYQLALVNDATIDERCDNLAVNATVCLGVQGEDCTKVYTIVANDTCEWIEQMYGISNGTLYANNPQINAACDNIYVGEVLCVDTQEYTYPSYNQTAYEIDPLDLMDRDPVGALDPGRYGLVLDKRYPLQGILHVPPSHANSIPTRSETGEGSEESLTLQEIEEHLHKVYVDRIGYEYQHCPEKSERLWFSHQLETEATSFPSPMPAERKKRIWELLAKSEEFDKFLGKKFPNLKRYGCEGAESMLPALDTLFELAATSGISSLVLALPHRGRLSLLTDPTLLGYSPTALFSKIKGGPEFDPDTAPGATGDVVSHLGGIRTITHDDKKIKVELLQNPSHLEAVNPVALGITRAKQMSLLKSSPKECQLGDRVLCVQLHGDAAFAGQGVVAESLGMSGLPHYGSGGTVHLIVNNNIGYTTPASLARSSVYSSDIGKMIGCPILHVNGDYPEAVARAVDIALRYRQMFRKDVIIDLICYRRWGHNELDEPAYTQPLMYEKIRSRKSVPAIYEEKLKAEDVLNDQTSSGFRTEYTAQLDKALNEVESFQPKSEMLQGKWSDMVWPGSPGSESNPATGIEQETLMQVARASVALPNGFNVHPRLKRHISSRLKSLDGKVDFATAEAMAFGSLMREGCDVRISGQDVGRGTFSQRHAMFVDQADESCLVPLNETAWEGKLELANSSLSEMAVLGFETGMSWASPKLLPIWEAQFGDFANGAQIIVDTFIVGAQAKWLKQSGLTMMLPHGYDGAGPDHSSCKLERFLQLSNDSHPDQADVNLTVVNPSTPAQLFHLLRRQMKRNYRRPMIIASPKGLLRSPLAASALIDMGPGTQFQPVLEWEENDVEATTMVLCTGKHYYTLLDRVKKEGATAIIRIEELSPFPYEALKQVMGGYTNARQVVWAQEEPANHGAYSFVRPRIERVLGGGSLSYSGRTACATTATGVGKWYKEEEKGLFKA
ncbi:putative 2-oxoglutarate dehydrogenase E1 component DHKTD1, partial [Tremellales sp. Uapishka_1]